MPTRLRKQQLSLNISLLAVVSVVHPWPVSDCAQHFFLPILIFEHIFLNMSAFQDICAGILCASQRAGHTHFMCEHTGYQVETAYADQYLSPPESTAPSKSATPAGSPYLPSTGGIVLSRREGMDSDLPSTKTTSYTWKLESL